ncbi:MAG: Hydroxymethylglutaryl-coenzyme A reductase [Bacteroidetes bacterium ADurb.Bin217]|nr:MAG: Hydroxymethylglutaryl-coenzyme A reductase [Bacteroidetes bacterium ADurb.Bin217]
MEIPIIPGRGLNSAHALKQRNEHMNKEGFNLSYISKHSLNLATIDNNIESFIGSVEVPLGIVGPLLFKSNNQKELVYCVAGTLEGALIASMNRGARAVSLSGGFHAKVKYQKMLRAPLFTFFSPEDSNIFIEWVHKNCDKIKQHAEQYSNHAKILEIKPKQFANRVHLFFYYNTGDASGQNMTTVCTWHAILWIAENFSKETQVEIDTFIIEGNGASDKKISQYTIENGRGIHVEATCFLTNDVIKNVLRTTKEDFMKAYFASREITIKNGMLGYNVNITNAIAAIFLATGQDLGSIHESSNADLILEEKEDGIDFMLKLTNLVIGSIGGGTHLPKQKEALELMGCYGKGNVNRFASLISGFALSLEISTFAAIVSGAFAKAHEKLGRNKPVNWLTQSELNTNFIQEYFTNRICEDIISCEIELENIVENGIITQITNKVSKKLIGLYQANIHTQNNTHSILIKSKALDIDVIKGLHFLAALIDVELADLISKYKENLEYWNCHLKEIKVYDILNKENFNCSPLFYGKFIDKKREIFMFAMEQLQVKDIAHINSQNRPELWTEEECLNVIREISNVHLYFCKNTDSIPEVKEFKPWHSKELYNKFISIMLLDSKMSKKFSIIEKFPEYLSQLEKGKESIKNIPNTIIHGDLSSRNIAIKKQSSQVCIYDWELAVVNIPHRDIVEFLSFVLQEDFSKEELYKYLNFHFNSVKNNVTVSKEEWFKGYSYALKEYLVTKVSFFEVAGIQAKYAFSERVLLVSYRMLEFLTN